MRSPLPLETNEIDQAKAVEITIRLALIPILTGWAKVAPGPDGVSRVDLDMVEIYAESLAGIKITAAELEAARKAMLRTNKFFPTVAEITEYVIENRPTNAYAGWVTVLDDNDQELIAPPHRALNGRLVEKGGNGIACPAMAQCTDVLMEIDEHRERLGVDALVKADPKALAEMGFRPGLSMASALPEREPITPEKEAELLAEVERTKAANRAKKTEAVR